MKKGVFLAKGKGVASMLNICKENGWSNSNTTLIVHHPEQLNSTWSIYTK